MPLIRHIERWLLVTGVALLAVYGLAMLDGAVSSARALTAFDQAQAAGSPTEDQRPVSLLADEQVDLSLWAEKRIRAYKETLAGSPLPSAVLSIDRLRLRAPLFEGTDEWTLNRGVGWIPGTARPGEAGNIGIAGHRDGFFRKLKDIALGEVVELTTPDAQATYVVDSIEIVSPETVEVLQPRLAPSLTLVTCYPFYFVGDAPQRFIVHATLDRTVATARARRSAASR